MKIKQSLRRFFPDRTSAAAHAPTTSHPYRDLSLPELEALFMSEPLTVLRKKWSEVPGAAAGRHSSMEMLKLGDAELARTWESVRDAAVSGENFDVRGWYHTLYRDTLRGKRVMDVGSGFGIDGITFAECGADMTFVDITESNLEVLRRICRTRGIAGPRFCYLDSFSDIDALPRDYDVIWCQGSMIHAPLEVVRKEAARLLEHLRIGGRWIELAYPRARWEREGSLPFNLWGERTDGAGTPWVEWYDLSRLLARMEPATFEVVLAFDFHNSDFNWFDLVRRT